MGAIYNLICNTPLQDFNSQMNAFELAVNPIAGAILALVIFSCYKGNIGNAFCFGLSTYAVTLLMFNVFTNSYSPTFCKFLVLRALILGLVCMLLTKPKYFYSSFIIFISYYLICKIVQFFLTQAVFENHVFSIGLVWDTLWMLLPDFIIYMVILFISIIYERAVLTVKKSAVTT